MFAACGTATSSARAPVSATLSMTMS
jgi:hypothetical protein